MVKVGERIRIICMEGEPQYTGKEGIVKSIGEDPWNGPTLRGTWGGCAVYVNKDAYEVLPNE